MRQLFAYNYVFFVTCITSFFPCVYIYIYIPFSVSLFLSFSLCFSLIYRCFHEKHSSLFRVMRDSVRFKLGILSVHKTRFVIDIERVCEMEIARYIHCRNWKGLRVRRRYGVEFPSLSLPLSFSLSLFRYFFFSDTFSISSQNSEARGEILAVSTSSFAESNCR